MYNYLQCTGGYSVDFHYSLDEVESVFENVSVFELAHPNHAIGGTVEVHAVLYWVCCYWAPLLV